MKTLLMLLISVVASAASLTWDFNITTDNVAYYRIYITQTKGTYTFGGTSSPNFFGSVPGTKNSFTIPTTFNPAVATWAVATAYNGKLESVPSNEIQIFFGPPAGPANFKMVP